MTEARRILYRDTRTGSVISCRSMEDAHALCAVYREAGNIEYLVLVGIGPEPERK